MKAFWIKAAGLAVTVLILFIYQSAAVSNARMAAALDQMREELGQDQAASEEITEDAPASMYKDGTYTGSGTGYGGELSVSVKIEGGLIKSIEITETADDPAYLQMAEKVIDDIIDGQTVEGVDTVSGATFSSGGILEAVGDALKGAEK